MTNTSSHKGLAYLHCVLAFDLNAFKFMTPALENPPPIVIKIPADTALPALYQALLVLLQ